MATSSGMHRNESSTAMMALAGYAGDSEPEIDSDVELETGSDKTKKAEGLVAYAAEDEEPKQQEDDEEDDEDTFGAELDSRPIGDEIIVDYNASVNSDSLSQSVRHLSTDNIELPAEPPGRCSNHLQEKFSTYFKKGFNLNAMIQKRKDFRNPSIYEKLISFLGIDEFGTNYPKDMFDPHGWTEESYYEALAKSQKEDMARRGKEMKERTKVEFVSGTVAKKLATGGTAVGQPAATDDGTKKRKSKWDQSSATVPTALARPPITVVTTTVTNPQVVTVTTTASGTKTTVISAVGTIKKPKMDK
ncbi:SAP30-binding protein-like isoform X1 [Saccoglossus kowalevskii]|uniref:SAP30-binding protein-like isoform 1 n=1 Tax=Saccoglossus kowalevskii TaxID=10224 RepID=A0ABM0H1B5_SACKO|nr:PREDICTED: SAP30-binding protein-like isoform 1 [Saccoglossus kowalevskii]